MYENGSRVKFDKTTNSVGCYWSLFSEIGVFHDCKAQHQGTGNLLNESRPEFVHATKVVSLCGVSRLLVSLHVKRIKHFDSGRDCLATLIRKAFFRSQHVFLLFPFHRPPITVYMY